MNRTTRVCSASGGAAHLAPYGVGTESGVRSLTNDKSPGMIMRTIVLSLFAMMSAFCMNGCEIDSFFNPSVTGYYESTPSSMPILSRIDVIERETGFTPDVTEPTAEDLVPNELVYRLAPGDVGRVEIYELVAANQTDVSVRVIDQAGSIRLPTLGDIQAAGLTVDELQEDIIKRLTGLISDPLVTVVLEDGRSFQFTIYEPATTAALPVSGACATSATSVLLFSVSVFTPMNGCIVCGRRLTQIWSSVRSLKSLRR